MSEVQRVIRRAKDNGRRRKRGGNAYVDDLGGHEPSPPEGPVQSLYPAIAAEEVRSADVRVLREGVDVFRGEAEVAWVVELVQDELHDFACICRM